MQLFIKIFRICWHLAANTTHNLTYIYFNLLQFTFYPFLKSCIFYEIVIIIIYENELIIFILNTNLYIYYNLF